MDSTALQGLPCPESPFLGEPNCVVTHARDIAGKGRVGRRRRRRRRIAQANRRGDRSATAHAAALAGDPRLHTPQRA